jgi:hypothetical protein
VDIVQWKQVFWIDATLQLSYSFLSDYVTVGSHRPLDVLEPRLTHILSFITSSSAEVSPSCVGIQKETLHLDSSRWQQIHQFCK